MRLSFCLSMYTPPAGYPGQNFCTTDGYTVTGNYGNFCLDYGDTSCADTAFCISKYGFWQNWCVLVKISKKRLSISNQRNSRTSAYPYCVTVHYGSGPGAVVEYTSYYCSTDTVSRTLEIYLEATGRWIQSIKSANTN
jgi:hypothetical protein